MKPGQSTGADHFRMAEHLLDTARQIENDPAAGDRGGLEYAERLTARAQVHATLALASANAGADLSAERGTVVGYGWTTPDPDATPLDTV